MVHIHYIIASVCVYIYIDIHMYILRLWVQQETYVYIASLGTTRERERANFEAWKPPRETEHVCKEGCFSYRSVCTGLLRSEGECRCWA